MKTVIKNKLYLGISAGLALVLLSGCGGGGGGGGSGAGVDPGPGYSRNQGGSFTAASKTLPSHSSVIQSSNGDGQTNPATAQSLDLSVSIDNGQHNFEIEVTGTEGTPFTVSASDAYDQGGGEGFAEYELYKELEDGHLWVDFYTNLTVSSQTNWLAGGVWLHYPKDASSMDQYEVGAFADGGDPFTQANLRRLTGTATYVGEATGVYLESYKNSLGELTGLGEVGYFDAVVELDANFGTNSQDGTIDGEFHSIEVYSPSIGSYMVDLTVSLPEANIGSSDSGFFRVADDSVDIDGETWSISWGGQFFGNPGGTGATDHPTAAGGTFGASTDSNSDGNQESLVGVWGAFKE